MRYEIPTTFRTAPGSMAKAAKQLATSQSGMSRVVAGLEAVSGVRLLDQTRKGVEPTHYGRALLKHTVAIFDDLKMGVDEIEFLTDPRHGQLTVGTTEPQSGIVVRTIELLSGQLPQVEFKVVVASGMTLINRDLRERQIELAVAPLPE